MVSLIEKMKPHAILEIGTFIGLSTGVIALASPPDTTVVSVDPNFPIDVFSRKFHYSESRTPLFFARRMLEHFDIDWKVALLEGYFSCESSGYRQRYIDLGGDPSMIDHHKSDIIGPRAVRFAPYKLVFIDGDHSTEAVYSDLSLVHHYLTEDGIIVLHDLLLQGNWGLHVHAGITRFIQEHHEYVLRVDENMGFLSRGE